MAKRTQRNYIANVMEERKAKREKESAEPEPGSRKERFTLTADPELLEEMRDCVAYHSGPPEHLTISGLIERGVRTELDKIKRKHHGGKNFPKRTRKVRTGRPPQL